MSGPIEDEAVIPGSRCTVCGSPLIYRVFSNFTEETACTQDPRHSDEEVSGNPVPESEPDEGRGLPVYHSDRVHVMSEMCSTCVFRPGNLMHLNPGRLKDMVDTSIEDGAGITCHKTIHGGHTQEAVCRGFLDKYAQRVPAFRLAAAMNMIEEVRTDAEHTEPHGE